MMQEHFYCTLHGLLYKVMVEATTESYLSTLKTYPTPGDGPITPFLHQNDRKGYPDSY